MIDLHAEADRYAGMIRPHVEQTGGVEPFFVAHRPGRPPLALPASFDTVEAKEEGLGLLRAVAAELGCTHVAWISEAWIAAPPPASPGPSPRDRPDRTEALMTVVEDAGGTQAVRIDPFSRVEGGVRWGETIRTSSAERRLLSGAVEPALTERARLAARAYQAEEPRPEPPGLRPRLDRMIAWLGARRRG